MRWLLLLMVIATTAGFAGSVRLLNDSPYTLRVVIRGNDGSYLGEMVMNAAHSFTWTDTYGQVGSFGKGNIKQQQLTESLTPYTVHWYCIDGGDYSICTDVPTGGTVTAQSCDGSRTCKPQKKKPGDSNQPEQYLQDFGPPNSGEVGPPGGNGQ